MYSVSAACKDILESGQYKGTVYGTIGLVSFTAGNIVRDSLTITNQCSGNANIGIGQVYVGQLKATFEGLNIADTAWNGKAITLYTGIDVNGTIEPVPMGVYYVTSADKTLRGMKISAYDAMYLLDQRCDTSLITDGLTPYEIAALIASNTGVTLGSTAAEIQAMTNGTQALTLSDDTQIETWRDVAAYLSQVLCAFVTAGRDGRIYFRTYSRTVLDSFDPYQRFTSCSFSDFVTSYSTIYFTNADGTESEYTVDQTGLIYEGGKNPFLLDEDAEGRRNAIILAMYNNIRYTPFTASILTNPIYDLGDVISFSGGIASENRIYCVTKIVFSYGKSTKLVGVGSNPKLAGARSRESKAVAAVEKETASNTQAITNTQGSVAILDSKVTEIEGKMLAEHIYPYGIDVGEVTDTDQSGTPNNVLVFRFNSEVDGNVFDFHGLLTFNVHTFTKNVTENNETVTYYQDGVVRVRYLHGTKADGSDWAPVATFYQVYGDGAKILTLNYNLHPVSEGEHFFIVEIQSTGASLYSMAVITAYLFGGKKMTPVDMLTLGEPSLDPAWTGDGTSSTLADWVEASLSSDYEYYWGTTLRDSGSVQRDPFVVLNSASYGVTAGWIALYVRYLKVNGNTYDTHSTAITLDLFKDALEALKEGDESAYIDLGRVSTYGCASFDNTPQHYYTESWTEYMSIGCTNYLEGGAYVWLAKIEAETSTTLPLFLNMAEADAFVANPTAETLAACINGQI